MIVEHCSPAELERIQAIKKRATDPEVDGDHLYRFLCASVDHPNKGSSVLLKNPDSKFMQRIQRLEDAGHKILARMARHWTDKRCRITTTFLNLYNEGFGCSEELFEQLVKDENDTVPSLSVFLLVLIGLHRGGWQRANAATMAQDDNLWVPLVKEFLSDPRTPSEVANLPMPLRFYGCGTNTVLGLYDRDLSIFTQYLNRDAQVCVDLGGGYATADLRRATGLPLICLDVQSPDPYLVDHDRLLLRKCSGSELQKKLLLSPTEREQYMSLQAQTSWRPWNVLDQTSLIASLGDFPEYLFLSTGFMTSNVLPVSTNGQVQRQSSQAKLSKSACRKVMELVALGKDVTLLTIERAHLVRRLYRSALLRWKSRELMQLRVVKDPPR